jgi:DNA-binding MarR family transcriptional regulator
MRFIDVEDPSMATSEPIYDVKSYQPATGVGQLMYRVRAAYMTALDQALAQELDLKELEISGAQYVILSLLAQGVAESASQLCKDISYDGGAMTRMIDRLEAKGLITRRRCPDDRRLNKLALTEAGRAAIPKLRAVSVRILNQFLRGFSQADARQLEAYLTRMLENA